MSPSAWHTEFSAVSCMIHTYTLALHHDLNLSHYTHAINGTLLPDHCTDVLEQLILLVLSPGWLVGSDPFLPRKFTDNEHKAKGYTTVPKLSKAC